MCDLERPRRPNEAVPFVTHHQLGLVFCLPLGWGRDENNVIASDNDSADILSVLWVRDVFRVFKYQVHVLIVAVQLASNRTTTF